MSLSTPPAPIELLRERCNRLVHGQCSTRRCLIAGGWEAGEVNYDKATCEYREAVLAMEENERLLDGVEDVRDELWAHTDDIATEPLMKMREICGRLLAPHGR